MSSGNAITIWILYDHLLKKFLYMRYNVGYYVYFRGKRKEKKNLSNAVIAVHGGNLKKSPSPGGPVHSHFAVR